MEWSLDDVKRIALRLQAQGVRQSPEVCAILNGTAGTKPASKNKFNAVKTPIDDHGTPRMADSKVEAGRWGELVMLERAGFIADLRFHPVYELPGGVRYEADSSYTDGGRHVVEDVKGVSRTRAGKKTGTLTQAFRNKWKQMAERYPAFVLRIEER